MNKLPREKQIQIISLLVEGNSIRSCERITGVHRDTIMRLAVKIGNKCGDFLNERMVDLALTNVQCDEIWTFVYKKQHRLHGNEKFNPEIGDQYLYVALDQKTKIVAAFRLGKRDAFNTKQFMFDLSNRIVALPQVANRFEMVSMPEVRERVANYKQECRPLISTDGWKPYPQAIEDAFAGTVDHGVLIKSYAQSEQPGRYGPPTLVETDRRPQNIGVDPADICTSHVERNNLTIRTFMRRFTRLALGFSKKVENLAAATALHICHYNFCRFHRSIRSTPAMKAGIAGHPWTMTELFDAIGM